MAGGVVACVVDGTVGTAVVVGTVDVGFGKVVVDCVPAEPMLEVWQPAIQKIIVRVSTRIHACFIVSSISYHSI